MRSSRGFLLRGKCILVTGSALLGLLLFASAASADVTICSSGSGAGQCSTPAGVAVNRIDDLLYVADTGNNRVDVFDAATGAFVTSFGSAQLSGPREIAVDNDPLSSAQGNIYVVDSSNTVKGFSPAGALVLTIPGPFDPIEGLGVGPGGVVHVIDAKSVGSCEVPGIGGSEFSKRLQKFSSAGAAIPPTINLDDDPNDAPCGAVQAFAVDSVGNTYLGNAGASGAVRKYDPSGAWLATFQPSFNIQFLALDAGDDLFVVDDQEGLTSGRAIYRYEDGATLNGVAYGEVPRRFASVAPYPSATGDVFAVDESSGGGVVHVSFPPPGPAIPAGTSQADPIGNTKATLNAAINPEGKATTFHFEYVDDATYQAEGFANPQTTAETALVPPVSPKPPVPPFFALASAKAEIGCPKASKALIEEGKCLAPETIYHFRAIATNGDIPPGGARIGSEASFETKEPFEILASFSSKVGADAARIGAEVNPLGIPASGHFELVEEAKFEASGFDEAISTAAVDFGAGEVPAIRSAQLHSLAPGTAYRYRVVVENLFTSGEGEPRAFTTFPLSGPIPPCPNDAFRGGPAALLPDCRAHEMVSPVDKGGGEIAVGAGPINNLPAELTQSAAEVPALGRGLAYSSNRAFGDAVSTPFTSQYMATRHPLGDPDEGWRSHGISPRREGASFFADDLGLDTQYKAFSEDLRWGWLRTDSEAPLDEGAIPGYANLYRRDDTADSYKSICPVKPPNAKFTEYVPEPQGFAADGSIVVFRANDKLSADAASAGGNFQLYGCAGGAPRLLSVLPAGLGGKASGSNSSAGTAMSSPGDHRELSLHNAVAEDGSRVYWTDSGAVTSGPGKIYLRERPLAAGAECANDAAPCTTAVSESVGGLGAAEKAHFWTASADGSVAIFSFTAGALNGNLYRFDAETGTASLIAEEVSGLAGWSEDASRLYLVSTKALAAGAAAGQANLYLYDASAGGGFDLVAALPGGTSVGGCALDNRNPMFRCTRATPSGLQVAFTSNAPLTGYDNADAASGKADGEVFLYDATANGGEGELQCVSCNPSGARPAGENVGTVANPVWVAAQIPPWENAFHAPRALSNDGRRLFFESYDALVLADTNGALDVYQWERVGEGGCDAADHDHFAQNGGCVSLISSGKSPQDSRFVDASADGADVFFKTSASLLPQDPGLIDIYDARVGGGLPVPPDPVPPCEGEACQSPPAAPQPPTPASSALQGSGNFRAVPKPPRPCAKGKRQVRRNGKALCVKRHKGKAKQGRDDRRGR